MPPNPDWPMMPATDQLAAIRSGDLSVVALAEATLDRIEALNGPLNAVVSIRPRAEIMLEAAAMDARPREGPLFGLPMAIKDLAEAAGIRCTYGSPLFADFFPTQDCAMVARLRAAGALIIGKTNTPEWGLGSNTYNPVHGITRNPFDPSRSAGGSSGGAGVALAARMLALADGSDMMGSLRNPAAWNNVYGMRPSFGLVPPDPDGELFLHQISTDGPLARNPRDLAQLLSVMAGPTAAHPHACGSFDAIEPFTRGQRVLWTGDLGGHIPMQEGILALCETALGQMADLGCEIVEHVPRFDPEALWQSWTVLRSFAIAGRMAPLYDDPDKRQRLKPEAIWEIERGLALSGAEIRNASATRSDWFRETARLGGDVLAMPSAQVFPFDAGIDWPQRIAGRKMDSYHRWMEVVVPASLTGIPAISVPVGFGDAGVPMGLQLVGHRGADAALLGIADAWHEATRWSDRAPSL